MWRVQMGCLLGILLFFLLFKFPVEAQETNEEYYEGTGTKSCPEFDLCGEKCLGYIKGGDGCPLCECDAEVLYIDDMKLDQEMREYLSYQFDTNDVFNPNNKDKENNGKRRNQKRKREATVPSYKRWDVNLNAENKWIIPYEIDSSITAEIEVYINDAIADYEASLCFDFVTRTSESDYILFRDDGTPACWAYVGRVSANEQPNAVQLHSTSCNSKGTVLHEIMHALGFFHEHQRPDRDDTLVVHWENILPGYDSAFYKLTDFEDLGVPFDTGSIMEYYGTAFSKNGQQTISHKDGTPMITQHGALALTDIDQLWHMYKCPGTTTTQAETALTTTVAAVVALDSSCADRLSTCAILKNQGACLVIPQQMKTDCGVTCQLCDCEDKASNCAELVMNGDCTDSANINRMVENCPLSCGFCLCKQAGDCDKWTTVGNCQNTTGNICG